MARLLRMPEVAANAVEAVLCEWPVPENLPFRAKDAIATVETEKAVVDVQADADGMILKTLVPAGAVVKVGAPIALLGDPGELVEDLGALLVELGVGSDPAPSVSASSPGAPRASRLSAAASSTGATDGMRGRIFSSPLARRLAREAGLSIADLQGSGPGGRIVRRDVEQAARVRKLSHSNPVMAPQSGSPVATPSVAGAHHDISHTRMRRAIAARLTESTRNAPHFFLRGSARVDKLLRLRALLNDFGSAAVSISVNDLVVAAAARAHVQVPAMNVIWTPDAVRSFSNVDICVAVATDRGLVTPVLRGVDQMTLSAVAAASSDLVGRARSGQLQQEELEGGTLTVTNLGMFGTEDFAAIINPPQSAILAVGAALQKPVVMKGRLKVGTVMSFTLSVDHRPIDGAAAAQWMAAFLSLLEEPVRILV
jgi:pyruvate dehydrogenase E2 component (dihydrolipoamide acetyltransferase)